MELHPTFKLNGTAYSNLELLEVAEDWTLSSSSEQKKLGAFLLDWLNDNKTIGLQTSGSTGTPKTIEILKTTMAASAKRTGEFFNLSAGNTALLCLPIEYIAGKMMLVRAMVLGLSLDVVPPKTAFDLNGKTYDFAALIPLQAEANLNQLGAIKTILIGGASISNKLRKSIAEAHTNCIETYGMTETLTHVATRPVSSATIPFEAMPDVQFAVDSESCLVLTVPYISNIPITTQDVITLVSNTSFQLLGRRDFVINSGGKKIFPEPLEEKLHPHLNIPFFLTGIPDPVLGEKLVLIIEATQQEKAHSMKTAVKILGADKHHVPKKVICVDAFVYTATAKLNRKATTDVFLGNRSS